MCTCIPEFREHLEEHVLDVQVPTIAPSPHINSIREVTALINPHSVYSESLPPNMD